MKKRSEYYVAQNIGGSSFSNELLRVSQKGVFLVEPGTSKGRPHLLHISTKLSGDLSDIPSIESQILNLPNRYGGRREGRYEIMKLEVPIGRKILTINRPTVNHFSINHYEEGVSFTEAYIQKFERCLHLYYRLKQLGDLLALDTANGDAFGNATRDLLIVSCVEVESIFKLILFEDYEASKGTIFDYWKIKEEARLPYAVLEFPNLFNLDKVCPFAAWNECAQYRPLSWYQAYNDAKHSAAKGLQAAKLKHVVSAVAAAFILLDVLNRPFSAMQRIGQANRGDLLRVAKVTYTRCLLPNQFYYSIPETPLRFTSL